MPEITNWKILIGVIFGLCTAVISLFVMIYFFDRKIRYKKRSKGLLYFGIILILSIILVIIPFVANENQFLKPVVENSYFLFPVIDIILLLIGFKIAFSNLNHQHHRKRSSTKRRTAN